MRRWWWILGVVILPQSPYNPYSTGGGRETTGGAVERADQRLDFINRQLWLEEQNYGANGRKNATNDAATDSQNPRAVRQGFVPGWSM